MSAWHFDVGKDWPGAESVVTPAMARWLASGQGLDLRLSEPVLRLAPSARGVEVTTTRGTHRASHAIVSPAAGRACSRGASALPNRSTRAAARDRPAGQGPLEQMRPAVRPCFLAPEVDWIDYLGPRENPWARLDELPAGDRSAAAGRVQRGGNGRRRSRAGTDRTTTASAMEALRAMFGSAVARPHGQPDQPLAAGPFALGAIPSRRWAAAAATARPVRRRMGRAVVLRRRGHSRAHPATVHGRLLSGQAAARPLLRSSQGVIHDCRHLRVTR